MVKPGNASSQDHCYNRNLSWYLKLLLIALTLRTLFKKPKANGFFPNEFQCPVDTERKEENLNANPHAPTFILGILYFTKICCNRPYPDSPESYYSPWSVMIGN